MPCAMTFETDASASSVSSGQAVRANIASTPTRLLIADARVSDHLIREVRTPLRRDDTNLELADGHAPVRAVEVRIHPRARAKL
jgi:hypothetical protein